MLLICFIKFLFDYFFSDGSKELIIFSFSVTSLYDQAFKVFKKAWEDATNASSVFWEYIKKNIKGTVYNDGGKPGETGAADTPALYERLLLELKEFFGFGRPRPITPFSEKGKTGRTEDQSDDAFENDETDYPDDYYYFEEDDEDFSHPEDEEIERLFQLLYGGDVKTPYVFPSEETIDYFPPTYFFNELPLKIAVGVIVGTFVVVLSLWFVRHSFFGPDLPPGSGRPPSGSLPPPPRFLSNIFLEKKPPSWISPSALPFPPRNYVAFGKLPPVNPAGVLPFPVPGPGPVATSVLAMDTSPLPPLVFVPPLPAVPIEVVVPDDISMDLSAFETFIYSGLLLLIFLSVSCRLVEGQTSPKGLTGVRISPAARLETRLPGLLVYR